MVREETFDPSLWVPRTALGKGVKSKEITTMHQLLDAKKPIVEPEVIDILIPNLESDLIFVGQSKGKFGGGKRRAIRQTQKKTREGSKLHFTAVAVVGNRSGYVGVGSGTARETVPAREKAIKKAKKNIMEVARGCGSWECTCSQPHSLPFAASGKCSSVELTLMPAPKGTGLAVEKELRKILALAGYKDLWSKVSGQTVQRINMIEACMQALRNATSRKVREEDGRKVVYGAKEE